MSVRVAEIPKTVGSEQFRYIKSKYNPADAPTREIAPGELEAWMSGPPFLKFPETEWPQFQEDDQSPHQERADTSKEMKTAMKHKQVDNREKITESFMPPLFLKKRRTTLSSATYCNDAPHSQRFAESMLMCIVSLKLQDTRLYLKVP